METKMPADDNSNSATAAGLLPPHHSENSSGNIDIEQGRIIISENTNGLRSSSVSATTTWPIGGLEHADVEDVAPVPLIQQIVGMGIEKDDTNTEINTNVAPCEDISITPQRPTRDAMEQIEEGDDENAPRLFKSAEFEDERRPKIELGEDSTNEDGGPPLASTSQMSSSKSQHEAPDATSAAIGGDLVVKQIGDHQRHPPGNEESVQQRVAGRGNNSDSATDNVRAGQVVLTAERISPPETILDAYLVEEDDDVDHNTVYEATPLESELPWWKQRQLIVLMVVICVLVTASSVGVVVSRPSASFDSTIGAVVENANTAAPPKSFTWGSFPPTNSPSVESTATNVIFTPSGSLLPTKSPTKPSYKCFGDRKELDAAVERYIQSGCGKAEAVKANVSCIGDSELYGWPMGSWCFGDVTDMSSLFEGRDVFNEDISQWNVGHVTNMNRMFFGATSFSGNVASWDVSSVTNMREMFKSARSFNENLCAWKDSFPYSNAADIFVDSGCTLKDNPLSAYQGPFCASSCTSSSPNEVISSSPSAINLFIYSSSPSALPTSNPPVSPTDCFSTRNELKAAVDRYVQGDWGTDDSSKYGWPIGSWCVGNVTDMSELFGSLDTFNEDISGWDVGRVTDMSYMFLGASSFNPDDLINWDTSAVTSMFGMFQGASAFNGDISSWDTSAVTDMSYMFYGASAFNQSDLSNWDTSAVTNMIDMFGWATSFNQNLCAWKDSFPYSNAADIFKDSGCTFEDDPSSARQGPFCASSCSSVSPTDCFSTRDDLKAAVDRYVQGDWGTDDNSKYGWPIGTWCVDKVTDMSGLFRHLDTFNEDVSGWNVGQVTDMEDMFYGASSYNQEDLSNWDTSAVAKMSGMFYEASAFNGNISSWNTSAVTDMSYMFYDASSFNPDALSNWDTSAVTTMHNMFSGASAFNGNISSWNTSAVTDMSYMFWGASSFNPDDLSKWDTSSVSTMYGMFAYASDFDGNISSWNTSAVTDMSYMFFGASSFNQIDLSEWDTSAVTDMIFLFNGASSFNQNLCAWKDSFPYSNATYIFLESGCTFEDNPSSATQGPFCASDCST